MREGSRNIAVMECTATQAVALSGTTARFDLVEYAHRHRYRLRNLNDGGPCPPAIWKRPKSWPRCPKGDEFWAIVGHDGYLADEGETGRLGIALFYESAKGVNRAKRKIQAMGGHVPQEGDTELAGSVPLEALDEALKLIRVSKVHPGNPHPSKVGQFTGTQEPKTG